MDFRERIVKTETLAKDIHLIRIRSEQITGKAVPGQFVNVRCSNGLDAYLRRPISICSVCPTDKTFDIVYMKRGKGTSLLCGFCEGDMIDVIGPLGSGFTMPSAGEKIAVVGGGIGIFPLLYLLESCNGVNKTAFLGFRSKDAVVMKDAFEYASNKLVVATDDGTFGVKGFVTKPFFDWLNVNRPDRVYTCGPLPMIKSVAEHCVKKKIFCEVSMEQRMGCGIGACLVCSCKVKEGPDFDYARVCKDGPVFPAEKLIFE
ncbi:MAG: dihydroorotate dehydrogenase electron transfer subunit [Bacillota bacterium]|jgi:dihydroorotate dehydrogenase electron transfer subunit|nr:dihydroorotate dehydrogenase electron transfer subunit [Bacillota bacterium]NLV63239.1 dihydroorotate dehydrogenase electron transfer subunit [Clostridiaceae bacterium]